MDGDVIDGHELQERVYLWLKADQENTRLKSYYGVRKKKKKSKRPARAAQSVCRMDLSDGKFRSRLACYGFRGFSFYVLYIFYICLYFFNIFLILC